MIPPKYPATFREGDKAVIVMGSFRGAVVKVVSVLVGWPYANYLIEHETEGRFTLNQRELGFLRETRRARADDGASSG